MDASEWDRWFAWHPVRMSMRRRAWLRRIERRRVVVTLFIVLRRPVVSSFWQYREIEHG